MGCSLRWLLLLWSVGSVTAAHGSGCSAACGILLDQELNPCPLLWQTDAWTLGHREVPMLTSWGFTKLCSPLQLLVVPRGRREYLFPLLILPVVHSALEAKGGSEWLRSSSVKVEALGMIIFIFFSCLTQCSCNRVQFRRASTWEEDWKVIQFQITRSIM